MPPKAKRFSLRAGSDETITGACQPCKNGRHHDCRSIERPETEVWPFFSDEEDREDRGGGYFHPESDYAFVPNDDWECECLAQARRRGDHTKHAGAIE
jgi:hypothetical protein